MTFQYEGPMRHFPSFRFAYGVSLGLVAIAPQGCGSSSGEGPSDAAADVARPDAKAPGDGGADGAAEGGASCGAAAPHGTKLVASPSVVIDGVTSDGYAIYTDVLAMTVSAVPLAGGTPMSIGMVDASNSVFLSGKVVYFEPVVTSGSLGATTSSLSAWSAATGTANLSSSIVYVPPGLSGSGNGVADVSQDGSKMVFLETQDGLAGTLVLASIDGKSRMTLLDNLDLISTGCPPFISFAGSNVLAAYCFVTTDDGGAPPDAGALDASVLDGASPDAEGADAGSSEAGDDSGDGGSPSGNGMNVATLAVFASPTFAETILATNVQDAFAIDPARTHVMVSGASGLAVYPVAGGAGVSIDSAGTSGGFTADGANVVYTTSATALKRSPVASPAPVTLVPNGLLALLALSPNDGWGLAYRSVASNQQTTDIYLASATSPGTATQLSMSNGASLYGDAFTADSKYAMYFDNVAASGVGDFSAAPTAGGASTKVASNAWLAWATAGSKVLLSDHCANCMMTSAGAADLEAVDLANPTAITTLVNQANANFYLTAAKDKLVYSWTCAQDSTAGVYVLAVP
jgi:hypothetical protein